jgi:hypothetical protein
MSHFNDCIDVHTNTWRTHWTKIAIHYACSNWRAAVRRHLNWEKVDFSFSLSDSNRFYRTLLFPVRNTRADSETMHAFDFIFQSTE